jgi:hypothetical protein
MDFCGKRSIVVNDALLNYEEQRSLVQYVFTNPGGVGG